MFFGCSIFTSRHASRHNAVQFLNISTSKSAPTLRCLSHFDFHMCFVPQRRYFSTLRGHKALENIVFRDSLPFRALVFSFFWLFLFSNLLSSSFLFSNSSHLFFSICPYCRKLDFETSFSYCFTNIIVAYFSIRQARWWPHLTCVEFSLGFGWFNQQPLYFAKIVLVAQIPHFWLMIPYNPPILDIVALISNLLWCMSLIWGSILL